MSEIKIGGMYRCRKHPECFFEPGSIVVITGKKTDTVVLAKLMFGGIKQDAIPHTVAVNTHEDGSVQCFPSELEPVNEKDT